MVARNVSGASAGLLLACLVVGPAMAGQMTAEEARRFVANKVFAFTCFDGTRGAGRIFEDGGVAGAVQFSGAGPSRNMRLPGNTLQVRGQAICASIKGIPFEPCFNLTKNDERSFRGAVSGLGFAYCDFQHQGAGQMLMARAAARPRSLRAPDQNRSADAIRTEASRTDVSSRVETPRVEIGKIESVKTEVPKSEVAKVDASKAESTRTDVAKTDVTKTDVTKTDVTKTDVTKTDLSKLDVSKAEPAKNESVKIDTAKTEGAMELRRSTD